MNEDNVVLGRIIVLPEPVGHVTRVELALGISGGVKVKVHVGIGAVVPVVTPSPGAVVLVVGVGSAALYRLLDRTLRLDADGH